MHEQTVSYYAPCHEGTGVAETYSSFHSLWRWVVSPMIQPLYSCRRSHRYPLKRSLGVPQIRFR